jgi:PadR family transcriptional regulator, regulatory protein PadR
VNGETRSDRTTALSVGLLRPCILVHLVGGDTAYGYELHHRLLAIGLECDLGTVYRALNTMEAEGLLHSTWERTSGGRSRRRYELSEIGLDTVDAYVAPVEQLRAVAKEFLSMRKAIGGRGSHDRSSEADPIRSPGTSPERPLAFTVSDGV